MDFGMYICTHFCFEQFLTFSAKAMSQVGAEAFCKSQALPSRQAKPVQKTSGAELYKEAPHRLKGGSDRLVTEVRRLKT